MLSRNIQKLYAKYKLKVYHGGNVERLIFGLPFDKSLTYSFGSGKHLQKYNLTNINELPFYDIDIELIKSGNEDYQEVAPYLLTFTEYDTKDEIKMVVVKKKDSIVKLVDFFSDNFTKYGKFTTEDEYNFNLLGR